MSEFLQWDARESRMVEARDAEPVVLPGYEAFQFFVSRVIQRDEEGRHNDWWVISEATTGASVHDFGEPTQELAVDRALRTLSGRTNAQIAKAISDAAFQKPVEEVKP